MTIRIGKVFRLRDLAIAGGAIGFVAILLGASFLFFDLQMESMLARRQAAIVDTELQLLKLIDEEDGRAALIRSISRRTPYSYGDFAIQALIGPDKTYLAGDVDWPAGLVADGGWRAIETFTRRGTAVAGYGRAIVLRDGAMVLVGRDRAAQRDFERSIVVSLLSLVFVLLAGTVALGLYLNQRILDRIGGMAQAAHLMLQGNAQQRFPEKGDTEFDRAGAVLNRLLDLNAQRLDQMRMVTDAIAHDLRQPFQRLRAHLERAGSNDGAQREAALTAADAEMHDALATLNNLLEVARADSGIGQDGFEPFDLAVLAGDLVEFFAPLAEEKDIDLEAAFAAAPVRGQPALMRHAIANLLQNAIKYTPSGGRIRVSTASSLNEAVLIVQDNGPGIPAAQIGLTLRPFGRLARDTAVEGKGLGLALVAACAKLHQGRLALEDAEPGLRVVFALPGQH